MASFEKSIKILLALEFSSPRDVLEKNPTEPYLTFMGIYQGANPNLDIWNVIRQKVQQYNKDLALVGSMLYDNPLVVEMVHAFYKKNYWDVAKLDSVTSQNTADEIFIFGVNVGMKKAIKLAQSLLEVTPDGVIGKETLWSLNNYDSEKFDKVFDVMEMAYYDEVITRDPKKKIYAKGWKKRALTV
jgi:hypothetical protein